MKWELYADRCRQGVRYIKPTGRSPGLSLCICTRVFSVNHVCTWHVNYGWVLESDPSPFDMADWLLSWCAFQLGWFTSCWQTSYVEQEHSSPLRWEIHFTPQCGHWPISYFSQSAAQRTAMCQLNFDVQLRQTTVSLHLKNNNNQGQKLEYGESPLTKM